MRGRPLRYARRSTLAEAALPGIGRAVRSPRVLGLVAALVLLSTLLAVFSPPVAGHALTSLDHPTRVKIVNHLESLPGDHFRSIVRSVSVSVGETRHHLNMLMRRGRIREDREGGRCRYYVNAQEVTDRNAVFQSYWAMQACRSRILTIVRERHAVRPSEVAADMGISRQLASYHLQRLAEAGQVRHERGRYQT